MPPLGKHGKCVFPLHGELLQEEISSGKQSILLREVTKNVWARIVYDSLLENIWIKGSLLIQPN